MKPDGFVADLRRKPEVLGRLAATLAAGNPWAGVVPPGIERVVLLGMGSSAYAGGVAAARMRARGLVAVVGTGVHPAASRLGCGNARRGDLGRRRFGGDARRPGPAARRRIHGGSDEHAGIGDHAAVRHRRRARTPIRRTAGWRAAAISTPWRCCWRSSATSAERAPAALAASVAAAATASAHLLDTEADWRPEIAELVAGARGNPSRRARAPVLLRPAGRPDASRGTTTARGRLRDGGLEPRRRLSDQDHRLPAARFRRFGMGAATRRVDHATGQHRRRSRR